MVTDTAADLVQAARDILTTARKMRASHATAHSEAMNRTDPGRVEQMAVEMGSRDALDSLLDSEAAQRLERALVRLEWAR